MRSADSIDDVSLGLGRHSCRLRLALTAPEAQVAKEKEGAILSAIDRWTTLTKSREMQGSANRSAKLVDVELRLAQTNECRRRVVEERGGVQRSVTEEVEKISVILFVPDLLISATTPPELRPKSAE